ncbi:MAG: hypothetical protein OXR66_08370 [Candidatus Woesearchaeota archaeon]|nr:hypothetical protein [Candidatus Woesearchaeota archaeon]
MADKSTILLQKKTITLLKDTKASPRQTYDELIQHAMKILKTLKQYNQYDEFLHKIQQPKMQELWDNEEDEAWENA